MRWLQPTLSSLVVIYQLVQWRCEAVGLKNLISIVLQAPFQPERDVTFRLYTRKNREWPDFLSSDDKDKVLESNFNSDDPVRLLVHGWWSTESQSALRDIKDAYLDHGDYNCIIVDWKLGAYRTIGKAQKAGIETGKHVANFIQFLIKTTNIDMNNTVVVGQSLGAHVAGSTGRHLNGKLPMIVGLDPCFPSFDGMLTSTDAQYVLVLHTDGNHLGLRKRLGTADFYFNGGLSQPDCIGYDKIGICSHSLSVDYFVESLISEDGFWGRSCDSLKEAFKGKCFGELGKISEEPEERAKPGIYYVKTNKRKPYARGRED